jgi:hypothetical protein
MNYVLQICYTKTVNKAFYIQVLECLQQHICQKDQIFGQTSGLHHKKVPFQTALSVLIFA